MSTTKLELRQQALTEVVETHRGKLLSVIRKMVRDQGEAEDVLQDVFEEFVETYDVGQAIETLGAWLVRVAQNKVLDRFRRRKTQADYQLMVQSVAAGEEEPDDENAWMQDWLRSELVRALGELPVEQRDVFVKHELEGKSFEEIASETRVGVNTLLSRKRYAVIALRGHLKEIYDELE